MEWLWQVALLSACLAHCVKSATQPWDLPVFPKAPFPTRPTHASFTRNSSVSSPSESGGPYTKKIPRYLWIAVKDAKDKKPDGLNYQMIPLFNRNPLWEVHIAGTSNQTSTCAIGNDDK